MSLRLLLIQFAGINFLDALFAAHIGTRICEFALGVGLVVEPSLHIDLVDALVDLSEPRAGHLVHLLFPALNISQAEAASRLKLAGVKLSVGFLIAYDILETVLEPGVCQHRNLRGIRSIQAVQT